MVAIAHILCGILCWGMLHNPVPAHADIVTNTCNAAIEWDLSDSPDITGYCIYYGTESGNYTNSVMVDNVTIYTISNLLAEVPHFFAVTAHDETGAESDYSNEIRLVLGLPTVQVQVTTAGETSLTLTGLAGQTYDIEATVDFATWAVIDTETIDDTGTLDLIDPDAVNYPQRFYRMHKTQP